VENSIDEDIPAAINTATHIALLRADQDEPHADVIAGRRWPLTWDHRASSTKSITAKLRSTAPAHPRCVGVVVRLAASRWFFECRVYGCSDSVAV
jgi:hypothetical protein